MKKRSVSISFGGEFSEAAVERAALELRGQMGALSQLAFVFCSPDYLDHLEEFVEILRVDGHVTEIIGATGAGQICDATETESASGFSVLAVRGSSENFVIQEWSADDLMAGTDAGWLGNNLQVSNGYLLLANPFCFPADAWLDSLNTAFPRVPVAGGLASGGATEESMAVFHNAHMIEGGVSVGLRGDLRLIPVVSQGCRPIGDPLPVTKADQNVIYSLGARPAYQALEAAFESLSDSEKSTAQGNLFAGLASSETVDEFKSGDFLIRNIIGADPTSGAVVIGGVPRLGQTVQYQLRDPMSADGDLRKTLAVDRIPAGLSLIGSVVFTCLGRGEKLFKSPDHDALALQTALGSHPSAGLFCNGEIGPVNGRNVAHTFSTAIALLCASPDQSQQ